jgi:cleavage stimulation factor subunit 2
LVFDRETGKPKGYGFCEFADHETALSAVRNLNGTDVGGRPLRIDLADSDPFLEGKTTVRGELLDSGYPGPSEPRSRGGSRNASNDPESFLSNLPPGKGIPPGTSALDSISQTLAGMPPSQLMEVLAQMKAFVITHPDQAKLLLVRHPQFSYALFQALLLNKIVPSDILERMLASSRGPSTSSPASTIPPPSSATARAVAPPHLPYSASPPVYMSHIPSFPPQQPLPTMAPPVSSVYPNPGQPYYRPPMPPAVAQPAIPPAPPAVQKPPGLSEISDNQRALLMQVLSLSPDQINALAESERTAIMQLVGRMTAFFLSRCAY